jgi:hypothetical protein
VQLPLYRDREWSLTICGLELSMRIGVLAASGRTGHRLATQALERGHSVVALARSPYLVDVPPSPDLEVIAADVLNPLSVIQALVGVDAVVSGLGIVPGDAPGTLAAGARALVAAQTPHIVWLSRLGVGASRPYVSRTDALILRASVGSRLADMEEADRIALANGATVLHVGTLLYGPQSAVRRTVQLDKAQHHRLRPGGLTFSTAAAAMLDEAEDPRRRGQILVASTARSNKK